MCLCIKRVLRKLDRIAELLERLVFERVARFNIRSEGGIVNINQGQSTTLTATPKGASGNVTTLPTGDVPMWTVDTPASVDVSPSADGLALSVAVHKDAPAGDVVFGITDGQIASAVGSFTLSIQAPAPEAVASFDVSASTPV